MAIFASYTFVLPISHDSVGWSSCDRGCEYIVAWVTWDQTSGGQFIWPQGRGVYIIWCICKSRQAPVVYAGGRRPSCWVVYIHVSRQAASI